MAGSLLRYIRRPRPFKSGRDAAAAANASPKKQLKSAYSKTTGVSVNPGQVVSKAERQHRADSKFEVVHDEPEEDPKELDEYEYSFAALKDKLASSFLDATSYLDDDIEANFTPAYATSSHEELQSHGLGPYNLRSLITLLIVFLIVFGSLYFLVEYLLLATRASACSVSTVYIPVTHTVTTGISRDSSSSLASPLIGSDSTMSTVTLTSTSVQTHTSYITVNPATAKVIPTGPSDGPSYFFTVNSAGSTVWQNGISPSSGASLHVITSSVYVSPVASKIVYQSTATATETVTVPAYTSTSFSYIAPDITTTSTSTSTHYVTFSLSEVSPATSSSDTRSSFPGISSGGWNSSTLTSYGPTAAADTTVDPHATTMTRIYYWDNGHSTTSTSTTFFTTTIALEYTTTITPYFPKSGSSDGYVTTITALPVTITPGVGTQSTDSVVAFSTSIPAPGPGSSVSSASGTTSEPAATLTSSSPVSSPSTGNASSKSPSHPNFTPGVSGGYQNSTSAGTVPGAASPSLGLTSASSISSTQSLPLSTALPGVHSSIAANGSIAGAQTASYSSSGLTLSGYSATTWVSTLSSSSGAGIQMTTTLPDSSLSTATASSAIDNTATSMSGISTQGTAISMNSISTTLTGSAGAKSTSKANASTSKVSTTMSPTSTNASSRSMASDNSYVPYGNSVPGTSLSTAGSTTAGPVNGSSIFRPTGSAVSGFSTEASPSITTSSMSLSTTLSSKSSTLATSARSSSSPSVVPHSVSISSRNATSVGSSIIGISTTLLSTTNSVSALTSATSITSSSVAPNSHLSRSRISSSRNASSTAGSSLSFVSQSQSNLQSYQASSTSQSSITNSVQASSATAMPTGGCGEQGNFLIDFDNLPNFMPTNPNKTAITQAPPIENPYYHLTFSDGYVYAPSPSEPYAPVSPPHLAVYLADGIGMSASSFGNLIKPGEIGDGPRESMSAFWFDAHSAWLGCDDAGPEDCRMAISGYTWNAFAKTEVLSFTQNETIPACPGLTDCQLHEVTFPTSFRGLTGLQMKAFVGKQQKMFFMDNLALHWTNSSCAAGMQRQSSI